MRKKNIFAIVLMALMLVACNSGGGDSSSTPTPPSDGQTDGGGNQGDGTDGNGGNDGGSNDGGNDGGGDNGVPNDQAGLLNGIYTGQLALGGMDQTVYLLAHDGRVVGFNAFNLNTYNGAAQVKTGDQCQSADASFCFSTKLGIRFWPEGVGAKQIKISDGKYIEETTDQGKKKVTLKGHYSRGFDGSGNTSPLLFEKQIELYNRDSSLAQISGIWFVQDVDRDRSISLNISDTGVIDGSEVIGQNGLGCVFPSGSVDVIDPEHNIYKVVLEVRNCGQRTHNGTYTGFATLGDFDGPDDTTPNQLKLFVTGDQGAFSAVIPRS